MLCESRRSNHLTHENQTPLCGHNFKRLICLSEKPWKTLAEIEMAYIGTGSSGTGRLKNVDGLVFLRRGNKIQEQTPRQSVEQRLKEKPSRDCLTWRSIPYTVTKLGHYCGCQEVLADRSLM